MSDAMDTAKDYRYAGSVLMLNLLKLIKSFFFVCLFVCFCHVK